VSAALRAVLRSVDPRARVHVRGPVPDELVEALRQRGTSVEDAAAPGDHDADHDHDHDDADGSVLLLRPPTGSTGLDLPTGTVVLDLHLGADDVAAAAAVAGLDRPARTVALEPDGAGLRWVVLLPRPDDTSGCGPAATVTADALAEAVALLGHRVAVLDTRADDAEHGQRVAASRQRAHGASLAEARRGLQELGRVVADLEERLGEVRGSVLATGGPTARVVAALRGELSRTSAVAGTGQRGPAAVGRGPAPLAGLPGSAGSLRVAAVGHDAVAWCDGAVRVLVAAPDELPPRAAWDAHEHVEAVVVGQRLPVGWDRDAAVALLDWAGGAGVPRVAVRAVGDGPVWWGDRVDLEVVPDASGADVDDGVARLAAARPVAAAGLPARGVRRQPPRGLAVVPHRELAPGTLADLHTATDAVGLAARSTTRGAAPDPALVALVAAADGRREVPGLGELPVATLPAAAGAAGARPHAVPDHVALQDRLREHRAVLDHPGLHPDPASHAHWLATLALARVPVLLAAPLPASVAGLLGPLADVLTATSAADLADEVARERRSVLALRAAWQHLTPQATWARIAPRLALPTPRPASVSMVLATNRPDHLEHAVEQASAQTWARRELVVVLHGDAFGDDWPGRVRARATEVAPDQPVTVLRAPAGDPLGAVLNAGCEVASGSLVTKVDDDDWYAPDHLVDLLAAREQSGAHLVGKGAEFTYLAELDLTIRRMADGGGTASRSLAGGTFLLGREDLWSVGGWPHVPRFVDQRLIDALLEAGGTLHRTHGFGFVLNRHGTGHTWDAGVDYFLRQAVTQHPGLALDVAAVR